MVILVISNPVPALETRQVYPLHLVIVKHDTSPNLDMMYKTRGKVPGIQWIGPPGRGSGGVSAGLHGVQPAVEIQGPEGDLGGRIWGGVTPLSPAQATIV